VNQGDTQGSSGLKNEKIQEEEKNTDGQCSQNQGENNPGPIRPESLMGLFHGSQGESVILNHMGTSFSGEGFGDPGIAPTLAAYFPLAVGTSGEILGIQGQAGVTNLTTLGIID
jgi:hypothetical protein